jgi:hypothetical protein
MSENPFPDPVESEARRSRQRTFRIVAALLAAGGLYWGLTAYREAKEWRARLSAASGRITLERDGGENLAAVERAAAPELWYRVILRPAPLGREVPLACRWIAPSGALAHANSWTTKPIAHDDWETHCRYRIGPQAETGTWRVEMTFGGRVLESAPFEVR